LCLLFTCWPWGPVNGGGAAATGAVDSGVPTAGGAAASAAGGCGSSTGTAAGADASSPACWLPSGASAASEEETSSSDLEDATQHGASRAMASATMHVTLTSASACVEALAAAMLADLAWFCIVHGVAQYMLI